MKGITGYLLFGCFVLFLLVACSKQPGQEINAAKSAVDSAMAEGAEKYSPSEAKKANDALAAAMNEVRMEDSKFIRDYKKAREMLSSVKVEADNLRAGLSAKKEEARKKAILAEESARASVVQAKASLERAMKSTKAKLDLEVLTTDIRGLDDSLSEIRKLIYTEDYTTAIEKATVLREKAADMAEKEAAAAGSSPGKPATKKRT